MVWHNIAHFHTQKPTQHASVSFSCICKQFFLRTQTWYRDENEIFILKYIPVHYKMWIIFLAVYLLWSICSVIHNMNECSRRDYFKDFPIFLFELKAGTIIMIVYFVTNVSITIIQIRRIHGINMCSRPIYWHDCWTRHFSMKIWYPTKWYLNVAIIY